MAVASLWWARIPATSAPWRASLGDLASLVPPPSLFIDVLPALILFGFGIGLVVAPLTSTLMSSIPARRAGLGSAINNAMSRVGTPLIGAIIFVVVSATFYGSLSSRAPGLDTSDSAIRAQFAPLNPPKGDVPPDEAAAAREASVDAFRVAALFAAGLLVAGSTANLVGLRGSTTKGR
jgi:hypothetical protein